jgi:5-methylcytosine-specific restriction endonuclease McrA
VKRADRRIYYGDILPYMRPRWWTVVFRSAVRRDPCSYCGYRSEDGKHFSHYRYLKGSRVWKRNIPEIDHIIPRANRPDLLFEWEDLTAACRRCNAVKGHSDLLFFLLDVRDGKLESKTEIKLP